MTAVCVKEWDERVKKLISLILMICLLTVSLPAGANSVRRIRPGESRQTTQEELTEGEEEADAEEAEPYILGDIPGAGYDFDFTLRLYPEAFSSSVQSRMKGYAELLEALRFEGSYAWALNGESFELKLNIIPVKYNAGAVDLWFHGAEDIIFIQSSLLGDQTIVLNNQSLLAFCAKMSEHLGLPLHYLALAYPYSWKYALNLPMQDWEFMLGKEDENGVISAKDVKYFAHDCVQYRIHEDEPLQGLINALGKDTDVEDALRAFVAELTDYMLNDVTDHQEIRILREGNSVVWQAASGDIYAEIHTEQGENIETNLPWMKIGYLPVFSWESFRENQNMSGHLKAQILGGEAQGQDLVNLEASLVSFPTTWPADAWSLLSLSLTGGLLPNVGMSCYLNSEANGHLRLEFRKPTVNYEPGAMALSLEGSLLPKEGNVQVREFGVEDGKGALELLVSNDAQIMEVVPNLVEPVMKGMLQFLVGIPTGACQTIMDDLTELGVFQVLIGD